MRRIVCAVYRRGVCAGCLVAVLASNNESIDPATACLARLHNCPARLSCALFGDGEDGYSSRQGFSDTEGSGLPAWAPPQEAVLSSDPVCIE